MRKLFLLMMTLIACTLSLSAQSVTYHGSVVDATNGEPLIGATIMPIGGGQGAAADLDGNFTLTVPSNVKRATVSYVGYKSATVDLSNGMKVSLSSTAQSLDDLVVVAYGTASKESLTGSVAVVGAKEIEDRPVTSVTAALEGNAPGVQVNNSVGQPGTAPTIRIRGFNSVYGSNAPLYVVDGVPYNGAISDLNPADIESMSVLKDAASCALYGNRGANGVVLITTKKAKNVGKVDVTLQVRQGMFNRGLPFYDRLDAADWMQASFDAYANGLVTANSSTYPDIETARAFTAKNFISAYAKDNIFGVADDQLFDTDGKFIGGQPLAGYTDLDWWKPVSRSGYRQEYNLNAAAATEKFNLFASIGYLKENGYMIDNDFERYNGRVNANFQPVNYFKFGVNLNVAAQKSSTGSFDDLQAVNNPFLTMFYAPIYPYYRHNQDTGEILRDAHGEPLWNTPVYLNSNNVAWSMRLDYNDYDALVGDASVYGTAVIPYGFELTVRGTMHRDKTVATQYTNNTVGSGREFNGMLAKQTSELSTATFMQTLTWEHEYGDNHIDVMLDHENYQYRMGYYFGQAIDQVFPNNITFTNFNNTLANGEGITEMRLESYLGRARYNYNQRYFAEASIRRDGSSRFSKEHRWGNFWSLGGSWIISKERFMEGLPWIDNLKLRAAYGTVGNDASAGAYSYYSLYLWSQYDGNRILLPAQLASNDIHWESTNTFDVALEGNLFNDRFNFSVGYFNKRNADLLFPVTMPLSMGTTFAGSNGGSASTVTTNIGTMQNTGWELSFGVDILRTADLLWKFNIDATFLRNKVVKLPDNRDLPGQSLFMGHSVYEMYMTKWAGVDELTGRSLYVMTPESPYYTRYLENGQLDRAQMEQLWLKDVADAEAAGALYEIDGKLYSDMPAYARPTFNGTSIPTVFGSFSTSLSWKNINLGILFTYGLGGKTYDSNYASLMNVSTHAGAIHKDVLKSWTAAPEGLTTHRIDPNGIPQANTENAQYNYAQSSQFLTSSNQLVLKNINLSYDLPRQWVSAMKLQNINLGVSIDNVFLVSARKGMNPGESFAGGQSASYVPSRVFSFQLGARF